MSAPKDFLVLGLQQERDTNPTELGQYSYDQNGESLQFFEIEKNLSNSVPETEQQTFPFPRFQVENIVFQYECFLLS